MMLTRCTACATTFRITPEQLKARQGKVRCGECQHIFNALDSLLEEAVAVIPPAATTVPSAPAPEVEIEQKQRALPPVDAIPTPDESATDLGEGETPAQEAESESESAAEEEALAQEGETTETTEATEETGQTEVTEEEHRLAQSQHPADYDEPVLAASLPSEISSAVLPEALSQSERPETSMADLFPLTNPERPPRSGHRWPWILGLALALLVLTIQMLLYFRIELAVLQPGLKPLLQGVCAPLGCDVPRPRRVELLGIETSDLHPDPRHKGHLQLAMTLRNRAPFAQELPYLELTLTDTSDAPLLVRSLAPKDYLALGTDLKKGFAARSELPLTLTLDVGDLPAAGYRLYLYFP